ncbi:uncharacterized protein Z520_03401 [Fonsecaea multimorphosa CBS 102226]|uniref:Uncharacterized protein n=1 Tax=Fonsecaea multimorphosa CBS 102226 TaxID=1442371 RepID=A0A0D2HFM4_9EURO|nr:uncharacterized protein Z520_03401 [Fonsecaea multimorphosa CBS 102226]KIY00736.1 hypothetical protein Z520_03401 [Fonsecaea multimorphosa CBS 102226]OAL27780.1 hypothetical protein AYO22_03322 [Fonsecaea multimorphosa]
MFDTRRNEEEHPACPSLSTVRSDESQGHNDTVPITRTETVVVKTRGSNSLGRKNSAKPKVLTRSETLSSKPALTRVPSIQTRYMEMLLHLDQIPRLDNILASLFTWILLAGFLVVPGTFTTFKQSKAFQNADNDDNNEVAHAIVHSIANIGLLWLAGAFCAVGSLGCLWLWLRWRKNYVWLINRIFLPVTMNSIAGLLTTLVNVYTAQHGVWSVTAKITAIVTGSCVGVAGLLFACYNFWMLRKVQKAHEREMGLDVQHQDETLVEKVKRKAHEPPLQSGSVV